MTQSAARTVIRAPLAVPPRESAVSESECARASVAARMLGRVAARRIATLLGWALRRELRLPGRVRFGATILQHLIRRLGRRVEHRLDGSLVIYTFYII